MRRYGNQPKTEPCPTCGAQKALTKRQAMEGLQCGACADGEEGNFQHEH